MIEDMDIEVKHSKKFSTFCLDDILSVESFNIIDECKDEEQEYDVDDELDVEQPLMIPN